MKKLVKAVAVLGLAAAMALPLAACGEAGKSAYDIAVEHGFVGTEEEWLESLRGPQGEKGEQGEQGEAGTPGTTPSITINEDGYWVINGEVTDVKAEGEDGKDGQDGASGPQGPSGTPGADGDRGSLWFNGAGTPTSAVAGDLQKGDMYLDTSNGIIWSYNGTDWDPVYSMSGGTVKEVTDTASLNKALSEAGKNSVIILGADIEIGTAGEGTTAVEISSGEVVIDLNGYTLNNVGTRVAISVTGDSTKLTLTDSSNGNGSLYGGKGGNNQAIHVADGAKVDIYGGSYSVGPDAKNEGNSCIEVSKNGGVVNIYGGTFSSEAAYNEFYYVLNTAQTQGAKGSIYVHGGTFINFDPAKGDDASAANGGTGNVQSTYVAEGSVCYQKDETTYIVCKADAVGENAVHVSTADALADAIKNGVANVELVADVTMTQAMTFNKDITLDLGEKTLTWNKHQVEGDTNGSVYSYSVSSGATLRITGEKGSKLVFTESVESKNAADLVVSGTGSAVVIQGVDVQLCGGLLLYGDGQTDTAPASLTVENAVLNSESYCISTNASTENNVQKWKNVSITVTNSTLKASTPIMLNVDGRLVVDGCTIEGEIQGIFLRAGEANISNSTISTTFTAKDEKEHPYHEIWASGNCATAGAIVIGNKNGAGYYADAVCTLSGAINVSAPANSYGTYVIYVTGNSTTYSGINDDKAFTTSIDYTGVTGGNFSGDDIKVEPNDENAEIFINDEEYSATAEEPAGTEGNPADEPEA